MNKKVILNLLFIASTLLYGCDNNKEEEKVIYIGTTMSIENAIRGEYNYDVLSSGCSEIPLIYQNDKGTYEPLLANFSTQDSKSWTYTILDNMKWSDGVDVSANDILFTLNYFDKYDNTHYLNDYTYVDKDGNTYIDEKTYESYVISNDNKSITLTLKETNVRDLSNMTTFRIMPKHIYENKDVNELSIEDKRVTCGPYLLESFDKSSNTLTYIVNEYYPNKPSIDKLVYKIFSNEDTMYSALRNKDLDTTWIYSKGVGSTYLNGLNKLDYLSKKEISTTAVNGVLMFNTKSEVFSNLNIRKAISYALNYDLFKSIFGGENARVANKGFAPESCIGYKDTEKLENNISKANELLISIGYIKEDKFYKKDGKTLGFELIIKSNKSDQIRMGELVKAQLEEFGIEVTLTTLSNSDFNSKISNKFSNNNVNFEACINGFTQAGMNMGNGLGSIYVDKNHIVQGGCQVDDVEFINILNEMNNASNLEKYAESAANLQNYYVNNVPMIALYWDNNTYFYNNRLNNIKLDANFGINNVTNWLNITLD